MRAPAARRRREQRRAQRAVDDVHDRLAGAQRRARDRQRVAAAAAERRGVHEHPAGGRQARVARAGGRGRGDVGAGVPAPQRAARAPQPAPACGSRPRASGSRAASAAWATARAAPPAPTTSTRSPATSPPASRRASRKPGASVLCPTSPPRPTTTVFTAPIAAASGSRRVEVAQDRLLVRDGDVEPPEAQRAQRPEHVAQLVRGDLERQVARVEARRRSAAACMARRERGADGVADDAEQPGLPQRTGAGDCGHRQPGSRGESRPGRPRRPALGGQLDEEAAGSARRAQIQPVTACAAAARRRTGEQPAARCRSPRDTRRQPGSRPAVRPRPRAPGAGRARRRRAGSSRRRSRCRAAPRGRARGARRCQPSRKIQNFAGKPAVGGMPASERRKSAKSAAIAGRRRP